MLLLAAACTPITGDFDRVIAIEIDGSIDRVLEEGETIQLSAVAISASGDTVPDAEIVWQLLEVDTGQVGFTLDPATGVVSATHPGSGRVRPRVDELVFDPPLLITVTAAPDSAAPSGSVRVTLAAGDEVSPSLTVDVFDLTTEPNTVLPLAGKSVTFQLMEPAPGSTAADGFFLTEADAGSGEDPHRVTATTSSAGQASIVVRRVAGGVLPDSAVIDASVATALGNTVPVSPITFVVIFESN